MPSSFQLVMRSGPSAGKVFPLEKGEIVLGRDLSNDIVINDPEISRRHARLYAQGNTYVLEDLGSTNGTFVGGQRLTGAYPLRIGEVITLGERVTVIFETTQPADDMTMVSAGLQPQVYQPPVRPVAGPAQPPVRQASAQQPPVMPAPTAQAPAAQPPVQAVQYPPQPQVQVPAYQSPAPIPPHDVYAGQVPYAEETEPPKAKNRTMLILLIILAGVLLISFICVFVLLWNAPLEFWCQFPIWPAGACP